MRARSFLLIALFAAVRAGAVVVGNEAPTDFVRLSRQDPGRLYALVIGATWCAPCGRLLTQLASVAATPSRPANRAVWDKVEEDVYGQDRLSGFLSEVRAPMPDSIPDILVFKGGKALGFVPPGEDFAHVEAFLADEERDPDPQWAVPRLACPGRDGASFTLGLNGRESEGAEDPTADGYGVETLRFFDFGPGRRLFYTPAPGATIETVSSDSSAGLVFVRHPLGGDDTVLQPSASLSTGAFVADFARAPGRRLRLILTGHGGPEGVLIRPSTAVVATTASMQFFTDQPIFLTEDDVARAVAAARGRGKTVRGLVLTCFGGQFAAAFMPAPGAPACAAFASLPEKKSEGCYPADYSGPRTDYASVAQRLLLCGAPRDGRALHYQVVASTELWGTPMLTSEYFLLYGPGASYLGRAQTAPAPRNGIGAVSVGSDFANAYAYIDLIGGGVLAVRSGSRELPLPRVAVSDCRRREYPNDSLDGVAYPGSFFLRGRITGPDAIVHADCAPVLALTWDPAAGIPASQVDFEDAVTYIPASPGEDPTTTKFFNSLAPSRWSVSTRYLKPEARVLLSVVLPDFQEDLEGGALADKLVALAARLRPDDPLLAGALASLAEQERTDVGFRTESFVHALWNNIDPEDTITYRTDPIYRTAYLAAAAEAELALRAQARTSPEARKLLRQFEGLQDCERGLY